MSTASNWSFIWRAITGRCPSWREWRQDDAYHYQVTVVEYDGERREFGGPPEEFR